VKLTVVGCSPAWPTPGGAQSGYLVEDVGGCVLVDCGPGVLAALRLGRLWPEPDAIVISHLHLDHWGDLVSWVWGSAALTDLGHELRRPELWLPPGGEGELEQFARLLGSPGMFETAFPIREYAPQVPFSVGACTLTAHAMAHFDTVSYALRLEAGGRTLAYSGDCGPTERLVEAARRADLFLCEATLSEASADGSPRGHLTAEEAISISERAGAAKLLIVHRAAELDVPAGAERAYDGLVCRV
jgi:ribonuclease BN (tRNA processing enzyme)